MNKMNKKQRKAVSKAVQLKIAVRRFHALCYCASYNGGVWVSAGYGTANVAASVFAARLNVPFAQAAKELAAQSPNGLEWVKELAYCQPNNGGDPENYRFNVKAIAKQVCRH